jgi:acetyltransferase-like isoleucine patch superfamily enzyme
MTSNLFPKSPPKIFIALKFICREIANLIPPSRLKNYFLSLSGITIGTNVFVGQNVTFIDGYISEGINLEDNCVVSPRAIIISLAYPNTSELRFNSTVVKFSSVKIGKNAWIGSNACILPGVTVGEKSVLGAGSVLTKSIPDMEIWAGNNAKKIRTLN